MISRRRSVLVVCVLVLLSACAGEPSCAPVAGSAACPDLTWRGQGFLEFRAYDAPPPQQMQELGDATYPSCNVREGCPGSELDGFGGTDVWLIDSVSPKQAVIAKRQNTDGFAIFVRVGIDADSLGLPGQ